MPQIGSGWYPLKTILYFYDNTFAMVRRSLEGILAEAKCRRWHVEPIDLTGRTQMLGKLLRFWNLDGIIVHGALARHAAFRRLATGPIPIVWCDADQSRLRMPYSGVLHDSRETARKMVRELLGLGFDSYAYVGWCERRDWSREREDVFRQEAERVRKGFQAFNPWKGGRCTNIVDYLEKLESFLVRLPRPCGVLAANDATAAHVLRIAEKAGVVVPDEMAVAGIDDDDLVCENTVPTLTSVAPDFTRSGKLAIELLARRMANPSAPPEIIPFGSADVARRQSTRRFAQKDTRIVKAIEYIRLNACRGIGVADVVREMGVNPRTAELRFKEIAGHSMRDEILSVRIARAKKMLADPRNSVDAVAVACGYSDARTLRHMFRTHLGISLRSCRPRAAGSK